MTVTDDHPIGHTKADILEALTHCSTTTPPSPARTRWCDPLLDELLELRRDTESVR